MAENKALQATAAAVAAEDKASQAAAAKNAEAVRLAAEAEIAAAGQKTALAMAAESLATMPVGDEPQRGSKVMVSAVHGLIVHPYQLVNITPGEIARVTWDDWCSTQFQANKIKTEA